MSEQIDWSKAPADATHHIAENNSTFECWLKPGYAVRVSRGSPDWVRNDYADRLIADCATARPTTPSWSGEGLPPVGVMCDVFNRELSNPEWEKCTILFAGKHRFLYDSESCAERCGYIENLEFRPIRTHEQIAADEREAALKEIVSLIESADSMDKTIAAAIYDAGYRKQEKPE